MTGWLLIIRERHMRPDEDIIAYRNAWRNERKCLDLDAIADFDLIADPKMTVQNAAFTASRVRMQVAELRLVNDRPFADFHLLSSPV